MFLSLLGSGSSRDWKHAVDHRPRRSKNDTPNEGNRSVQTRRHWGKEVFHQNDVAIANDDLSNEENDGLQGLAKRMWDIRFRVGNRSELGESKDVSGCDRSCDGGDYA